MNTPDTDIEDTMGASELGKIIGRSTISVKSDVSRNPRSLPPLFRRPNLQRQEPRWQRSVVREWLQAIADEAQEQRQEAEKLAKKYGYKVPTKPFHLGHKDIGTAARNRMEAKA